jgi:hypothetical membrane protein
MGSSGRDVVATLIRHPLRLTGLATVILAWVVIYLAVQRNPWFVFTEHAFSDLGGALAANPAFFNNGMKALGGLFVLYALVLVADSANKVEAAGGAFAVIAGFFLALIGFYPSGITLHAFVSLWFFLQTDLAIITWGLGILVSGWRGFGAVVTGIGVVGPLAAVVVPWPSIAVLEAYCIALMSLWVGLMLRLHYLRLKTSSSAYGRFEER